ncbi:MAG: YceI family protein [Ferruginibacter sp.]
MQNTKWVIDPMHSEVHFKIKHLVISTVTGAFKKFEGDVTTAGNGFENGQVNFSIDVKSIDTNQQYRDTHLKSEDFFDTEKYPTIHFSSTDFKKVDDENYTLLGNLTMKDVTKPVELAVEYGGTEKDENGNKKHGFEISGNINRKEFGLTYNSLTETGGLALGENVKLIANIQVAQQN